jgi:hypothetical protein
MTSSAEVPADWLGLRRSPRAVQALGDRDVSGRTGEVGTRIGCPERVLRVEVRTGPALVHGELCGGSGRIGEIRNNTTQQCDGKRVLQCGQRDR